MMYCKLNVKNIKYVKVKVMNEKCCDDSALSRSAISGTELNSNADSTYSTIVWPGAVLESAQLDQVYISRLI